MTWIMSGTGRIDADDSLLSPRQVSSCVTELEFLEWRRDAALYLGNLLIGLRLSQFVGQQDVPRHLAEHAVARVDEQAITVDDNAAQIDSAAVPLDTICGGVPLVGFDHT